MTPRAAFTAWLAIASSGKLTYLRRPLRPDEADEVLAVGLREVARWLRAVVRDQAAAMPCRLGAVRVRRGRFTIALEEP